MKCGTCGEKATWYVSLIIDGKGGETGHADGYECDEHAEMAEANAERDHDTIEFSRKPLR